ncbi:polyprenyl synthetase family protein [Microbacter sp. GSS18]|nr:polyprenyl synthetase family protein [Microbacter sp. GSS18]
MGPEADLILDAASTAVSGGKRLRGRFCMTGWRAVTGSRDLPDEVVSAAAALEIFHAAALVHDDLIDNSDTRRGRPAAHRALEAAHRDAGWTGDAAAFGRSAAILLGDLLVAWSDDLFEEGLAAAPADAAGAARREYATMRREVTVGQFLDIAEESAYATEPDERHAERALRVASFKSARYSVQQPLAVGAALAGADAAQAAALARFGHPLGMAFQLRDDVLGVFGDAERTGKPAGDDLREGKRTVLVAYTREALSVPARRILDELLGDPGLGADQVASLQRTIVETGALDRLEALISDYARDADRALIGARLDNASVGELRDLLRAATERVT